jgi:hypothetical protein
MRAHPIKFLVYGILGLCCGRACAICVTEERVLVVGKPEVLDIVL